MPRFVILEHDHPVLHWDLMLEAGEVLQTWRLAAPPLAAQPIAAMAVQDHRRLYLDYEGPVSGNRGTVRRWDHGVFTENADSSPPQRALLMQGARVCGTVHLVQIDGPQWRFEFVSP